MFVVVRQMFSYGVWELFKFNSMNDSVYLMVYVGDVVDVSIVMKVFNDCYVVDSIKLGVDIKVCVCSSLLCVNRDVFDEDIVVIFVGLDVVMNERDCGGFFGIVRVKQGKYFVVFDVEGNVVYSSEVIKFFD